jgi:Ulp1 family protease
MPASQAIFYDFTSGSGDLENLAKTWALWKVASLRHVLIPVNLNNKHWCLLVVDLEKKLVVCWDSLVAYDGGEFVKSKKGCLFAFLKKFTGDGKGKWDLQVVFKDIPQQTISDCGVFCIEFMRAFINGCKVATDLQCHVQQASMRAARQHILRELKKKEILQKNAEVVGEKRDRKRIKKYDNE